MAFNGPETSRDAVVVVVSVVVGVGVGVGYLQQSEGERTSSLLCPGHSHSEL